MLSLKLSNSISGLGKTGENIYSLALNGSDEYVDVDNSANDVESNLGTVSAWVKLNSTNSTGVIFQARADSSNYINVYYHNGTSEGRIAYRAGGSTKTAVFTDAIENDGKWHHIAATWNVSADEIKIYLDGTLKDTTTGQNTQNGSYFNGNIAQVAVFTQEISISRLFVAKRQPLNLIGITGLVGYWKFDEGSGTVASDSSMTGNAGELINTPTWSTTVPYTAN